ncbi:MAG TPA: glutaredoxin family protein [Vicinamibacterales bacterium]|nr:glutaredoxin family protein [Vicinamibacterales bacterium]
MKEFLSREGHVFEAKNVEEDDSAYDELLALGARSVPVTVVDDQVITGFDQTKLRAALAAAAGGSQSHH